MKLNSLGFVFLSDLGRLSTPCCSSNSSFAIAQLAMKSSSAFGWRWAVPFIGRTNIRLRQSSLVSAALALSIRSFDDMETFPFAIVCLPGDLPGEVALLATPPAAPCSLDDMETFPFTIVCSPGDLPGEVAWLLIPPT